MAFPGGKDAADELRRAFHSMDDAEAERAAHLILQLAADPVPELSLDDQSLIDRAVGELPFFKNLPENVGRDCARSFSVHREKTQTADISSILFEQAKAVRSKAGLWFVLSGTVDIRKMPGPPPIHQESADAMVSSTASFHDKSVVHHHVRSENSKASLRSPMPQSHSFHGMADTPPEQQQQQQQQQQQHARVAPEGEQAFGGHRFYLRPTRLANRFHSRSCRTCSEIQGN